jgi:hypothetical protein
MKAKNPGFTLNFASYSLVSGHGFLSLMLAFLLLPAAAFSQENGVFAGEDTFDPLVSDLKAESKNNLIRLTWEDSRDARGPVYIYRSDTPFNTARPGFGKPPPVEVPYGVEYYIDETETTGTIYYFIAASDGDGNRYDILLPAGNSIRVDISDLPFSERPVLSEEPKPLGLHRGIYALETTVLGEEVTISFLVNFPGRDLVLYRSVQPITRTTDLLSAVIVQSGLSSPFTDYPVPGIQYYYAVIFEDELIRGRVGIYPGHNATQRPVEVKSASGRVGLPGAKADIRSMPLPLMSLNYAVPGLEGLAEAPAKPVPLSPAARQALESQRPTEPRPGPKKKPRAFSQDLDAEPAAGEEQALKVIVRGYFLGEDWENSCIELRRYLSLHHTAGIAARARFYLAQSLYFSPSYGEALREFLLVKDFFPQEANEWIKASLAALVEQQVDYTKNTDKKNWR